MKRQPLAAAAFALAAGSAWGADCDIDYRFEARWEEGAPHFAAHVAFDAGGRTRTALRMASEWGGVSDFAAGVRDVRGASADVAVAGAEIPNRWIVRHPPQGRVEVRYDVVNAMRGVDGPQPMDRLDFYRNALGARHFQVTGHGVLLHSESHRDETPLRACFAFTGLPAGWAFASSDGEGQRDGTAAWTVTASPARLRATLFLGGDWRMHRGEVGGRPVWLALRGTYRVADADLVRAVTRVIAAHRAAWDDYDFPHFLISISPNRVPAGSTGGTALYHAFAMHASNEFALDGVGFEQILVHEHGHTWLPRRLGTMGPGEAARYWFSEGFTNDFAHRSLVHAGLWSLQQYASTMNEELRRHFTSPVREVPNKVVLERFWKDMDVQKVPYRRGELFAIHLSRRLEARGSSLDAVLRGLKLPADALPRESDARAADLAVERLRAAAARVLGHDIDADLRRYITEGALPPVEAGFLGPCFTGEVRPMPVFELGFDAEQVRKTWKMGPVAPGSAADRAGVREGLVVRSWSYQNGRPESEVTLELREDGALRTVKYLPVAAQPAPVPQFRVREDAAADPACQAWTRGL